MPCNKVLILELLILLLSSCSDPVASVSGEPPVDGLVAYWKMDGNGNDSSGNGHHGDVEGAVPTEDRFGLTGAAMYFDGNDWMDCGDFREWSDEITITSWVYFEAFQDDSPFLSKEGEFHFRYINHTGRLVLSLTGPGNYLCAYTAPTDEWIFFAAVYDGEEQHLYCNDQLIGSRSASGFIQDSEYQLYVASDRTGNEHYLIGRIDDVRIYDRALANEEVLSLYYERGWYSDSE